MPSFALDIKAKADRAGRRYKNPKQSSKVMLGARERLLLTGGPTQQQMGLCVITTVIASRVQPGVGVRPIPHLSLLPRSAS